MCFEVRGSSATANMFTATRGPSTLTLILVFAVLLDQMSLVIPQRQKSKEEEQYEKRPYKFQFNIEDHHHRKEQKDEKGIIMGEFGFVTADFFYLTTVYATDEEGKFHILSRSRKYIGPPTEKPPTKFGAAFPRPGSVPTTTSPRPQTPQQITTKKPNGFPFNGLIGCSSCVVPTTTKRPLPNTNANSGRPPQSPISGNKPTGGQSVGGVLPPGTFGQGRPGGAPFSQGVGGPATSFGPGQGAPGRPGGFAPGGPGQSSGGKPGQGGQARPGSINQNRPFNDRGPGNSPLAGQRPGDRNQNSITKRPGSAEGLGLVAGEKGGPNYKFNYTVGFHGHHETGYTSGSKEGGYFANHRDGEGQRVVYEANEFGYQPNVTKVRLTDEETPKLETEKDYGLKGYEFKWFN